MRLRIIKSCFKLKKHARYVLPVAVFLGYSLSFGDDESVGVHVINGTPHFVHVFVEGEPFLYVKPGGSVRTSVDVPATIHFEAIYAPGQGVVGQAKDTSRVSLHLTTQHCGSYRCNDGVSPSTNVIEWNITPDKMLQVGG